MMTRRLGYRTCYPRHDSKMDGVLEAADKHEFAEGEAVGVRSMGWIGDRNDEEGGELSV